MTPIYSHIWGFFVNLFGFFIYLLVSPLLQAAEDRDDSKFHILSVEEARSAIIDESVEPYFSILESLEIAALTNSLTQEAKNEKQLTEIRELVKSRFQDWVLPVSKEEASVLNQIAVYIDTLIANDYPIVARQGWKILKVDSQCCGSSAHTRSDVIVLPEKYINQIMQTWRDSQDLKKVLLGRGNILLHEQIHILQRYHPELFRELYRKLWGFVHVNTIQSNPWVERHILHNPDAYDLGYLLNFDPIPDDTTARSFYQLRTLLIPEDKTRPVMGKNFRAIAIETEQTLDGWIYKITESGKPVYISMDDDFKHPLTGVAPQNALTKGGDHPHEIFAYSFTAILTHHYLGVIEQDPDKRAVIKRVAEESKHFLMD